LDNYYVYAAVIFLVTTASVGLAVYETVKTTNKLHKMSYYEIPVVAYRKREDGSVIKLTLKSSELVPGDVFEVPEGVFVPCDAILLNGTCIMNESMLTGESIPVVKNSIPNTEAKYDAKEDKQYTLFSGTKCIQARGSQDKPALALVTLTGFATVKGDLIRTMLFPKPSNFEFYYDSFKFIGILAAMAIIGSLIDLHSWIEAAERGDIDNFYYRLFVKSSQIITITVPPALPTCMQIGISVALSR